MLARLLKDLFAPQPALPLDPPPPGCVPVRLDVDTCLTAEDVARLGGPRRGTAWWWIRRKGDGWFPRHFRLPRGDQPVDCTVLLPPGRYTLGTGRGDCAIRIDFTVRAPRPEEGRK